MAKEHSDTTLLELRDLVVHYECDFGVVEALNGINLHVSKGETLGLVGETGAGKTTIAKSIMGLLPTPPSKIIEGSIQFKGRDLTRLRKREYQKIRGRQISMIFQDPMTALNPVMPVGNQISEVIRKHERCSRQEAMAKARKMLTVVGIDEQRYKEYPHQFSGGMKQRVVIAIALACNPELLIADEPTTALDVTIQAQVLELMKELKEELDTAMLLITHDLGVVVDVCDRCAVLYAGEIVEMGTTKQIFTDTRHPYTVGLFNSLPSLDEDVERLKSIPGMMSDPMDLPPYCSFYDRCERRNESCLEGEPAVTEVEEGHFVRCIHYDKGVPV